MSLESNEAKESSKGLKKVKTQNPSSSSLVGSVVSTVDPPLEMRKKQSQVVQSLFVKKDKFGKVIEEDQGFLVKGTFNRFAASF